MKRTRVYWINLAVRFFTLIGEAGWNEADPQFSRQFKDSPGTYPFAW